MFEWARGKNHYEGYIKWLENTIAKIDKTENTWFLEILNL